MAQEMSDAVKAVKDMDKKLVVAENRYAYIEAETKRLTEAKDSLQAELDKKTADYNVYIAQRDAETKKARQNVFDDNQQLMKDRQEFQAILQQFQKDKEQLAHAKKEHEANLAKATAQMDNVRNFVIAVQRACSLIGL